jgi:hypothetical protein
MTWCSHPKGCCEDKNIHVVAINEKGGVNGEIMYKYTHIQKRD